MLRWWNGLGWSDARKAPDAATARTMSAATQALASSTVTPQDVLRTAASKSTQAVPGAAAKAAPAAAAAAAGTVNPFAAGATALGFISLLFGLFGVLPAIGLVLSIAGLVRGRRLASQGVKKTGLGQSLVGLVLSIVGLIRWLPFISGLPDVMQQFGDFLNS